MSFLKRSNSLWRSHRMFFRWLDAYEPHHAAIFVFEQMTVKGKKTDGVGIAEIDSQLYGRILSGSAIQNGTGMVSRRKGSLIGIPNHSSITKCTWWM